MRLLAAGSLVLIASCGAPAEEIGGPGTTTTASEAPASTRPAMEIVSATACTAEDPWSMVETAFEGTVVAIEPKVNEERNFALGEMGSEAETDTWQWVTFEVASWYTNDFGTEFSMWAPDFAGVEGENWLVAGALYGSMGQQSGEVFPCVSTPATEEARHAWDERYGSPVPAGTGVPEAEPDPALLAEIQEHRAIWEAAGIDDYTAGIYDSGSSDVDGCGPTGSLRVTVVDGAVTSAIDVWQLCHVEDLSDVLTISQMFDVAVSFAGAVNDPVLFDEELGSIRSYFAWDRRVEVSLGVEMFQPTVTEAVIGTEDAVAALAENRAAWEELGPESYSYTVEVICFCTISGPFDVTVIDGEVVEVVSEAGPVDLESPDQFMTYDVEGLFDLVDNWGGGETADAMLAAFDPTFHFPTEVRIDLLRNGSDDELTFFVTDFEPA